jgi:hypothetical protein
MGLARGGASAMACCRGEAASYLTGHDLSWTANWKTKNG